MKLVYPTLGILIVLSLVGGFLMLNSICYNTAGSLIIASSKSGQFSLGLATMNGVLGIKI